MDQKLTTYDDGSQVISQTPPNVTAGLAMPEADIVSEELVNFTDAELNDVASKMVTGSIEVDTMSGNISVMPNTMPETENNTEDKS